MATASISAKEAALAPSETGRAVSVDLSAHRKRLAEARETIEDAFLTAGEGLAASADLIVAITRDFEQLLKDFESAEIIAAEAELATLAERTKIMSQGIDGERQTLSALSRAVSEAAGPIDALERTILTIGIVSVNARIAAASSGATLEQASIFTEDIPELFAEATEIVSSFAKDYWSLASELTAAQKAREQSDQSDQQRLATVSSQIGEQLDRLSAKRAEAVRSTAETAETSRETARGISTSLLALQVGDSARQRIEHVELALSLADDLRRGRPRPEIGAPEALPPAEAEELAEILTSMQVAQLEALVKDLGGELAQGCEAINKLAREASDVAQRGAALASTEDGGSEATRLADRIRSATALMGQYSESRAEISKSAERSERTVADLLGYTASIEAIERRMRHLSLNATIRCASMGDRARALSVLSEQTRELSQETVLRARDTAASLETIASCMRDVAELSSQGQDGRSSDVEQSAVSAMTLIETVDARLTKALERLQRNADKARAQLSDAASTLGDQQNLVTAMSATAECLAEPLKSALAPIGVERLATAQKRVLDAVRGNYSMDAERRVHDAHLGAPVGPAAGQQDPSSESAAAPSEDDLDDVFF